MANFSFSGGVGIIGFISPVDTNDTYAVIDPIYGIDGFRNVDTLSDLHLISAGRRRAGMVVGVDNGSNYYKLKAEPWSYDISDWETFGIFATGATFIDNILTITNNDGTQISSIIDDFSGLTVNGVITATTVSATTFYGDGSKLSGIVTDNFYTTGFTYNNNNTFAIERNGNLPVLIARIDTMTGLTVNGDLITNTISATTYYNLPLDIRVTGATYSNNTFTYTNNANGSFNVLFNTVTGLTVNGKLTVTGNTILNSTSATTLNLSNLPIQNNSATDILARNILTGEVEFIPVSAITPDTNTFITGTSFSSLTNILTLKRNDNVNVTQNINSEFINQGVFYVSKPITTSGLSATITGLTLNGIVSTHTGYTQQLSVATMGSKDKPYPCPWSARNAALDLIASSGITSALIIIDNGDFTVGSPTPSQNGNTTGSAPNSVVVADVCISNSYNTNIASLLQNKLTYRTNPNSSSITYINSAYNIYFAYHSDSVNDATFECNMYGLNVYQVYGQINGWLATFMLLDNARSKCTLDFNKLYLQQAYNFNIKSYESLNVNIKECKSAETTFLELNNNRDISALSATTSVLNFYIENFYYGYGKIPYPSDPTDYWTGALNINRQFALRKKIINVEYKNIDTNINPGGLFYLGAGGASGNFMNTTINYKIGSLIETEKDLYVGSYLTYSTLLSIFGSQNTVYYDNSFNFEVGNAVTETALFGSYSDLGNIGSGNTISFKCGKHVKVPKVTSQFRLKENVNASFVSASNSGGVPTNVVIDGTFINREAEALVSAYNYTYQHSKVIVKGIYKTYGTAVPAITLNNIRDKYVSIQDAIVINDGTVDSIKNGVSVSPLIGSKQQAFRNIYFKNVRTNSTIDSSINEVGENVIINPDITNYL